MKFSEFISKVEEELRANLTMGVDCNTNNAFNYKEQADRLKKELQALSDSYPLVKEEIRYRIADLAKREQGHKEVAEYCHHLLNRLKIEEDVGPKGIGRNITVFADDTVDSVVGKCAEAMYRDRFRTFYLTDMRNCIYNGLTGKITPA